MSLLKMTRTAYRAIAWKHNTWGTLLERRDPTLPSQGLYSPPNRYPYKEFPPGVNSREEWEAYSYNPPPLIRNPQRRGLFSTLPKYVEPPGKDEREEVLPKPTWDELLEAGFPFLDVADVVTGMHLTREERHELCEFRISRIVYGASIHRHEHYVKDRIKESPTRAAYRTEWVDHLRQRFHQIEAWFDELESPSYNFHWSDIEDLCAFDYFDDETWTSKQWTPPTRNKPFVEIFPLEDPHPGPPPGWKIVIERLGVVNDNVGYVAIIPFRAKVSINALQDDLEYAAEINGTTASNGEEVLVQSGDVNFSVRFTGVERHGDFRLTVKFPKWDRVETQEFSADVRG